MHIHLENLTWTDAAAVGASLAAFLEAPVQTNDCIDYDHPEHVLRHRAVKLLSHLAGLEAVPLFTQLLLDEAQHEATRLTALEALRRREVRLPASILDRLGPRHGWLWNGHGWPAEVCDYLSLVEGSAASPEVWAFLRSLTPFDRALFLIRFHSRPCAGNAEFRERLYQQWLQEDRELLEGPGSIDDQVPNRWVHVNARILSFTRDRPESATVLEQYRRGPAEACNALWPGVPTPPDGWESLPPELWSGVGELLDAVRAAPAAYAARAECLDLPYEALLEFFTTDTLEARIEAEIRAATDRCVQAQAHGQARHECMLTSTYRALELFKKCPEDTLDDLLLALMMCPDMHENDDYVWSHLYSIHWERTWKLARDLCRTGAREWLEANPEHPDRGRFLLQLAADPQPEDREFFWRSLNEPEKAEFRFRALLALETLGEDNPEWRDRLSVLAEDPDPLTAIEARTALYRRGDLAQLDAIAALGANGRPLLAETLNSGGWDETSRSFVRAMWVRRLGELNAQRFRAEFERVLQEPVRSDWGFPLADRREAAFFLSRLDDDAARTALLRACLGGPVGTFEWIAEHTLLPGAKPPPPNPVDTFSDDWRRQLPWVWLCC